MPTLLRRPDKVLSVPAGAADAAVETGDSTVTAANTHVHSFPAEQVGNSIHISTLPRTTPLNSFLVLTCGKPWIREEPPCMPGAEYAERAVREDSGQRLDFGLAFKVGQEHNKWNCPRPGPSVVHREDRSGQAPAQMPHNGDFRFSDACVRLTQH